jgi:hypothetical protein
VRDPFDDHRKLLTIVQDGQGTRESWQKINGRTLRRVINLYSKEILEKKAISSSFHPIKEGYLASELGDKRWRCHIFEVVRD